MTATQKRLEQVSGYSFKMTGTITKIVKRIRDEGRATFIKEELYKFFSDAGNTDRYYSFGPYKIGKTKYGSGGKSGSPIYILYGK